MKKMTVAAILLASAGVAHAGGQDGSIGVGAEYQLSGLGGASLNYDAGQFHVGGFLAFEDQGPNTDFGFGARFYYHVHATAMSDFGIGGNLGYLSDEEGVGDAEDRASLLFIEPGIQFRAFITSNVAVSFTAGISLGLVDADGASISGQPNGAAGIHYYFF